MRTSVTCGLFLALLAVPGCGEPDSGPEAELNQWLPVGPVSVVVRSVTGRQVTGSNASGEGYSRDPLCVITIGFRVDESNKEVQYVSPTNATLRDAEGRTYRAVGFGAGVTLNEARADGKVLRTGQAVADILMFEKDALKAKDLQLRFKPEWKEKEGGAWKSKSAGNARFKIAR